jgi:hypothetical protein
MWKLTTNVMLREYDTTDSSMRRKYDYYSDIFSLWPAHIMIRPALLDHAYALKLSQLRPHGPRRGDYFIVRQNVEGDTKKGTITLVRGEVVTFVKQFERSHNCYVMQALYRIGIVRSDGISLVDIHSGQDYPNEFSRSKFARSSPHPIKIL